MIIYTDASRQLINNKFHSAWAFIVVDHKKVLHKSSDNIINSVEDCNTACEFVAIYNAIKYAKNNKESDITIKTDSLTFIEYWNKGKTHNKKLYNIILDIQTLLDTNDSLKLEFVKAHGGNKTLDSKMNNLVDKIAKKQVSTLHL